MRIPIACLSISCACLLALSCSSTAGPSDAATAEIPADIEDAGTDLPADVGEFEAAPDAAAEATPELPPFPVPLGPETRGWKMLRGIVHLHSALSHDGCGPDGYEDFGGPDPACIAQLRAAPCESGIDFMFMTDHPAHLKDHPYEEGLHFQPGEGDELIEDAQGRPFANRISCPDGSVVEHACFFYGTEGNKNMPIGLSGPDIPPEIYSVSYGDSTPLDKAQAAAAMARELGGFAWGVHTEEQSISVERIVALPLDGMEIYNLHANLLGGLENLETILALDRFMVPGPDPDLSLLPFLGDVKKDLEKFDQAAAQIRLGVIAATDIHRNVEIPALCPGSVEGSLCEQFAADYPNFVQFLTVGGPVPLSDGDRMDSYARSFRWFSNHALVKADDPEEIRQAVGHGRMFSSFDLFGFPGGFDFFVVDGEATLEMGEEAPAGQPVAYLRTPTPTPPPWLDPAGLDFGLAQVITRLVRATADGTETVAELKTQGEPVEVPLPGPGAYSIRAVIKPLHLKPRLQGVENLGGKVYPYIYSNAIFLR